MVDKRPDFSFIVSDNETAAKHAYKSGDYVQAYLLIHALVESLLRVFLGVHEDSTFHALIARYGRYLTEQGQTETTFVQDLTELNRRRNRIVHELWRKGYSFTNRQAEPAAAAAVLTYGLFIEWLETFDPNIRSAGFRYD